MNAASESLNHNAHQRQREKGVEREPGTDRDHEGERARGIDERVGRIHDGGAEQHTDRVQVVGGARHDVARPMALVVGVRQAFESLKKIVAESPNSMSRETPITIQRVRIWNIPFGTSDNEEAFQSKGEACDAGDSQRSVQIVGGLAEHSEREENPNALGEKSTQSVPPTYPQR